MANEREKKTKSNHLLLLFDFVKRLDEFLLACVQTLNDHVECALHVLFDLLNCFVIARYQRIYLIDDFLLTVEVLLDTQTILVYFAFPNVKVFPNAL